MSCRIYRTKEGKIEKVLAPNGKHSELYSSIKKVVPLFREESVNDPFIRKALAEGLVKDTSDEELALGLYAKFDLSAFKDWFTGSVRTVPDSIENEIVSFLREYGIKVTHGNVAKPLADLANKTLHLNVNSIEQLSEGAAAFMVELLPYTPEYEEIKSALSPSEHYKTLANNKGDVVAVKEIAKEILIPKLKAKLIEKKGFGERLANKVLDILKRLFNRLTGIDLNLLNRKLDDIVSKLTSNDPFIKKLIKKGYEKVEFQDAIDRNPLAKQILTTLSDSDAYILTGSLAYSPQGTVYRKVDNMLHDLDFLTTKSKEEIRKEVPVIFPGSVKVYDFELATVKEKRIITYIVPPPGRMITEVKRYETSEAGRVVSYKVVTAENKVVGEYSISYDFISKDITENKTGEEAIFVDFFIGKEQRDTIKHTFTGSDNKRNTLKLSHYAGGFATKLELGREKDALDYKLFTPYTLSSRLIDKNGEPTLWFHGSPASFEAFKNRELRERELPLFFTDDIKYAEQIAKAQGKKKGTSDIYYYPVVLKAEHLIESEFWMRSEDAAIQLDKTGADAIIGKEDGSTDITSVAVRKSSQVKSLFNVGSFSDTDNIYFQLGNENVQNAKVAEAMIPLLNKYGIKTTSLQEYADQTGTDLNTACVALADSFRKVIAIAKGKEDSTTLPEEFAHIIVDTELGGYELRRALGYVVNTYEYREKSEQYRKVYAAKHPDAEESTIETKVRKEILGQLLGKHIIKKIERKGDFSLMRMLKNLYDKFIALFKTKDTRELSTFLEGVTDKVFEGFDTGQVSLFGDILTESPSLTISVDGKKIGSMTLTNTGKELRLDTLYIATGNFGLAEKAIKELGEQAAALGLTLVSNGKKQSAINSIWASLEDQGRAEEKGVRYKYIPSGIYYQLSSEKEKILKALEDSLTRRIDSLRKRGISPEDVKLQRRAVRLEGLQAGKGIATFLQLVQKDSDAAIDYIISVIKEDRLEEYLTGKITPNKGNINSKKLSYKKLDHLGEFIAYYEPYINDLENYLGNKDISIPEIERKKLLDVFRSELEKFRRIAVFHKNTREIAVESIFREAMAEELNLDINDPDIDKLIADKIEYEWKENLSDYTKDTPQLEFWFGSMRDATDQILRAVYIMLARIQQLVQRNTLDFGREIIRKAESLGLAYKNMNWAYEKETITDPNTGKSSTQFTGNLLTPWKETEFQKEREKMFKDLALKYGYPEEFDDFLEEKERLSALMEASVKGTRVLTTSEKAELLKFKKYNKDLASWFSENTIPLSNASQIMRDMKANLTPEQYKEWYNRNVGKSFDFTGQPFTYYKGELTRPSDGSTKINAYNGARIKTTDWANTDWNNLSVQQQQFINWILEKKAEINFKLPPMTRNSLAPQITEGVMDILFQTKKGIFSRLGKEIKETFQAPLDEDYLTGEQIDRRPDGSIVRYIPVRFTKKMADPDRISTDLISSMVAYYEMAENYSQKAKALPRFNLIQERLAERRFQDTRSRKAQSGSERRSYQYLEKFLDMNISEMRKNDAIWLGINWTKVIGAFANYVRTVNLGWNLFTQFSNMVSSQGFGLVEAFVGEYFNVKSRRWAFKEFWKNMPEIAKAIGDPVQTNKMALLMQYIGISGDVRSIFDNMDKSKLVRKKGFLGDPFIGYEFGDFVAKAPVMLAALHNYRLYEGKWYMESEFSGTPAQFEQLPSAWEIITVDANGNLELNMDTTVFNKVASRVKYLSDQIDGKLSPLDYASVQQHAVFSLIMIHRGWLVSGLQRRFKTRGFNYMTGAIEEGHYNVVAGKVGSIAGMIKKMYFSTNKMEDLRSYLANWQNLDPVEKRAVIRVLADMAFAAMAFTIAVILNNLSDDDEDDSYVLDVAAYLGNRVALEAGAFFNPKELVTVIESPFVPLKLLEYSMNVLDLFETEDITRGPWKGWNKQQRFFMRLFPGVKFAQIAADPDSANQFLKNKPLKWVYDILGSE